MLAAADDSFTWPPVLAVHFCTAADAGDSRDPFQFCKSLVAQLARYPALRTALNRDSAKLAKYFKDPLRSGDGKPPEPVKVFHDICETLRSCPNPHPKDLTLWLAVDSLDEGYAAGYQAQAEQAVAIPDLLLMNNRELPFWLRLLLTTRPQDVVLDQVDRYCQAPEFRRIQLEDKDHEKKMERDFMEYLDDILERPIVQSVLTDASGCSRRDQVREMLKERSGRNFQYLSYLAQSLDLEENWVDAATPADNAGFKLKALLDPPDGLFSVYNDGLTRVYAAPDRPDAHKAPFDDARKILAVMVASEEPVTDEMLLAAGLGHDTLEREWKRLRPFVWAREPEGGGRRWVLAHQTFKDFLYGEMVDEVKSYAGRTSAFAFADRSETHGVVAAACLSRPDGMLGRKDGVAYAIKYAVDHLRQALPPPESGQAPRHYHFEALKFLIEHRESIKDAGAFEHRLRPIAPAGRS